MHRCILLVAILAIHATPASAAGTLTRAAGGEPQTLDPQHTTSVLETAIESDLFEGLTARGPNGKVVPGVADRWETSTDGKSWTFHLRPDAQWSNGMALTADDFVYALRRELDPKTQAPMATQLANITGAEAMMAGTAADLDVVAVDPHTLHIGLVRPSPFLAEMLAYPFAMPLYRPAVEADRSAGARHRAWSRTARSCWPNGCRNWRSCCAAILCSTTRTRWRSTRCAGACWKTTRPP